MVHTSVPSGSRFELLQIFRRNIIVYEEVRKMNVFILVRWEGDYHEILGVYSDMTKLEGASLENIASMNTVSRPIKHGALIEFNVFEVQLDASPPLGEYSGLKHTRKFHLHRKLSEFNEECE
jgi:hypothetical protein